MTQFVSKEVSLLNTRRRYNPKTGTRTVKVSIRLYQEELDTLIAEAKETGVSLSKLIKQKLTKGK
jgi:hypothetical protein